MPSDGSVGSIASVLVVALAAYGFLLHAGLLVLTASAFGEARVYRRRRAFAAYEESFGDPLARGVSLIAAVRDRSEDVVDLVQSMTSLRYPDFEIVLVDDGSSDDTAQTVVAAFDLRSIPLLSSGALPVRAPVEAVWTGRRGGVSVTVLRKAAGGRADAWNAAVDVARNPLVVVVDSHVVLDPDALLHVARPFADDPQRMVATTGVVRVLNGCSVRRGRVTDVAMPPTWVERMQVLSYLESYLVDRAGWSALGALPRLSGEVACLRRDRVREVGGWRPDLAEPDVELVARLHRWAGDNARPHRLVFVAEPVAWAPVAVDRPSAVRATARADAAIATALREQPGLLGRPRYGAAGVLAYPWLALFTVLTPVMELAALLLSGVGLISLAASAAGLVVQPVVGWSGLVLLALAWPVSGVLLGWSALLVDEVSLSRYTGVRALVDALLGTVLLHLVWRWATTLPRLRATARAMRGGAASPQRSEAARLGDLGSGCHTGESAPVHARRR